MKRRTERIARHSTALVIATAILLAFAGVALSQVVNSTPADSGGSTPGSTTAGSTTRGNGGEGNGQKVQICHKTHSKKHPAHTIWVAKAAEPSFLARGDHEGACTDAELRPVTSATSTTDAEDNDDSDTDSGKPEHRAKPHHAAKPKHGKGK